MRVNIKCELKIVLTMYIIFVFVMMWAHLNTNQKVVLNTHCRHRMLLQKIIIRHDS